MSATEAEAHMGCGGCFSIILLCLALWALLFGVTINGKHYGVSGCDTQKGVVVDK